VIHLKSIALVTRYWKPLEDWIGHITRVLEDSVEDGDIVVISDKAISTATGSIFNERGTVPSFTAKVLAKYWMRYIWTYFLAPLCHLSEMTIQHIREYPIVEGSVHKQVVLQYAGFLQALLHSSEGGIDSSNLPYSYVSIPLKKTNQIAEDVHQQIISKLDKNVIVMIADTDKTYSWRNFHFTPRPGTIEEIHSVGGILSYLIGRVLRLRKRATPLAIAGSKISVEEALNIADLADQSRGLGAGKTVWDMAETFKVSLNGVSWEMLEGIKHMPVTIVRRRC